MAEEVQIRGTDAVGKIRNPLGVVGLTFITLGIYFFVWYYKVNKEMAELGRARNTQELGTSPATSLMAILFGWILLLIPPLVSEYKTCARLSAAERHTGRQGQGMEAGLLFLLWLFVGPVGHYIFQSNLNKVLQAQAGITAQVTGGPMGAMAPPPSSAQQPAPPPPPPPG